MSADRRTLLIVAGEFPPLKTIGRIRTVKFIKHLKEHGWDSVVLTLEPSGTEPNYDEALLNEISPGTTVHRIRHVSLQERLNRLAKRFLKRGGFPGAAPQAGLGSAPEPTTSAKRRLLETVQPPIQHAIRRYVEIPDDYLPWSISAVREARRICACRRIDAVFTTLPPFSAAIVGYQLRATLGIPWIVDYRDLWYGDVLREWLPRWRQQLELFVERRLLGRAHTIVTVSEQKTAFMRRLHPTLHARWATLTNGYDRELYAGRSRTHSFDPNHIEFVYTGRLFKNRRGYAFAEALGRIAATDPELVRPVFVRILGHVSPEIRSKYDEILVKYGVTKHFEFAGDVSQDEAVDRQINCDYLLLIVDTGATSDGVIPGKLFEYVAANRPIFALCDPGATQQIIERSGAGCAVPAESVEACEAALRDWLSRPVPRQMQVDWVYLEQFDRNTITARLARLLDDVVKQHTYQTAQ